MSKLAPENARYFSSLFKQFQTKTSRPLLRIGQNFFPSALLSDQDRTRLLGTVQYESLLARKAEFEEAAKSVALTLNPMNGGIGTTLKRESYIKSIWRRLKRKGKPALGAKGSDLFFEAEVDGETRLVSISEAKIRQALHQSGRYASTVIEQLASTDTQKSVETLMAASLGMLGKGGSVKFSKTLCQASLPTIAESGKPSQKRMAPGGHGHWGVHFLMKAMAARPLSDRTDVHAIYNEDGINNMVDPVIAGWMAKEKVPIAMITTTKTSLDKKGGLIGVLRSGWNKNRKEILEEAQAALAGQKDDFHEMGLSRGQPGGQFFNTNTALLNFTVLGPILKDLSKAIGKDKILETITPRLIENKKSQMEGGKVHQYIQLEGALGSSLMELDGFLQTSDDPKVKAVLLKHGRLDDSGRVDFLRLINVAPSNRLKFFTPIKNPFDFWMQFYSDLFQVNPQTWELESRKPGSPPSVTLDDHYSDLGRTLESFGHSPDRSKNMSILDLDSLAIKGEVKLAGAILKGRVSISSEQRNPVDLRSQVLENAALKIDSTGLKKSKRTP